MGWRLNSKELGIEGGLSLVNEQEGGHIWPGIGWLHSSKPDHKNQCSLETSMLLKVAVVCGRRKTR